MYARGSVTALARGLWLVATALPLGILLPVWMAVAAALAPYGIGRPVMGAAVRAGRAYADAHRRSCEAWFGEVIENPYRECGTAVTWRGLVQDPATWRDLAFTVAAAPVGFVTGLFPLALLAEAIIGIVVSPLVWMIAGSQSPYWRVSIPLGVLALVLLQLLGDRLARPVRWLQVALLGPGRGELARRVRQVRTSRAEVVDDAAVKLRRIERDLHDGAQARLISLGMTVGLAEEALRSDPDEAAALLREARATNAQALEDLRGLVRGIHPPVLADRGLAGAVQALAASLPLTVKVAIAQEAGDQMGPALSADAYFAIVEALTNAVKHSAASHATVTADIGGGVLRVRVTDNGRGGAVIEPNGGLAGIVRRLAAFDGSVDVASPPGGPTVITMAARCGS